MRTIQISVATNEGCDAYLIAVTRADTRADSSGCGVRYLILTAPYNELLLYMGYFCSQRNPGT